MSSVYVGDIVGAALSFLLNDRVGRRWSFRIFTAIWMLGYVVLMTTPTVGGLYASRIISGIGIGALSVIGPMTVLALVIFVERANTNAHTQYRGRSS